MKLFFDCFQQFKRYSWLTTLICLLTIFSTAAIAEYKKPKKASSPDERTTTSTATRGGCLNRDNSNLTAIAPYSHVGQTISTSPTFVWFIPESEYFPLEFHLEEYTTDAQPKTIYKQELSSKPGIMSLSLPSDFPGLTVGKTYRWKVVMRCTRYRAVVTMAEIEVVALTTELQTLSASISSPSKSIDLYSTKGLWYDALAITLDKGELQPVLPNQLIKELAAVEIKSDSDVVKKQGEKLKTISDRL